jgi:uncharacterized protein YcbX
VTQLARYPVKGFTAQILGHVHLRPDQAFPLDRMMAVSDGTWRYDKENYVPLYKDRFIALMTHPMVATLRLEAEDNARRLTIHAPDGRQFRINAQHTSGDQEFLDFLSDFAALPVDAKPELIRRESGDFTDLTILDTSNAYAGSLKSAISIMNLASVRDLATKMGESELDQRRLRANIYFDSGTPWEEAGWLGGFVRIGGAVGKVIMATPRCVVTAVNPDTGERDRGLVQNLLRFYRHKNLGVYIDIVQEGEIRPGDVVEPISFGRETHSLMHVPFNGAQLPIYIRDVVEGARAS